ncbi:hypothetical protein F5144DRAFT_495368 [Chaetomium tenue]|uniref:Uncharacterized protein n=1 Tax=Chaetomium tenue TaxID=1854479 RepID=A0ACB7NYZ1_9PEZI|nr:hypothetical protein F5144DRAFT_495368 [Chaetomium globosum]
MNLPPQGNHGVPGPPRPPGQGPPLDVLSEIRNMIKEELKQVPPSPTSPEVNVTKGPIQQPARMVVPNMSAPRPQPPPPFAPAPGPAPAPRGSPAQQAPNAPQFPRPPPGVQWDKPTPPRVQPPPGAVPDSPKELSAIDKKWGVLFDKDDVPTKRWEQVVRGIGNYLMDEFMPQNTLVVTPGKMAAFYSHHKLELEAFPFTEIFRGRQGAPPARLAELYQQLGCEYYLVPAEPKARPTVPGLTLAGWSRWMTLAMRAYPNEESQRLGMVVATLPINAAALFDIKPERLPKQISRHLLPERPDRQARVLLSSTLKAHLEATTQHPPRSPDKAPPAFIHLNPIDTDRERRIPRPLSPRTRYRPTELPSPPSSQAGDDDYHHRRRTTTDRDRDRDRDNRERTYRDPLAHLPPHASHPPLASSNRPAPPLARRRHSMSGGGPVVGGGVGGGRGEYHPERGHLPRSSSDSAMEGRRERGGSREGGREVRDRERDRDRDREREREREREMGRERPRDRDRERDRERERERERDREREREREVRLGGRESGREQRERPRERRSSSAAGFPERRGSSGMRKPPPVVVRNGRKSSRDRSGGGGLFSAKNALTFCRVGLSLLDG